MTDFGLAKNLNEDLQLTATNQTLGTPSFMPPEQAAGKGGEIGPTADVYALGAILYAMRWVAGSGNCEHSDLGNCNNRCGRDDCCENHW